MMYMACVMAKILAIWVVRWIGMMKGGRKSKAQSYFLLNEGSLVPKIFLKPNCYSPLLITNKHMPNYIT